MTNAPTITTQRTIIREIEHSERESLLAYRGDAETNKYQGWLPKTLEDVDTWLAKRPDTFNKPNTWFQLVIEEQQSGDIIGDVGIHFIGEQHRQCELGCTIRKQNLQQGYGSEAVSAVCKHLFLELDKHRLEANILHPNIASARLFEKVGFRKEGDLKQAYLMNDEWLDTLIYSLLRSDWEEAQA